MLKLSIFILAQNLLMAIIFDGQKEAQNLNKQTKIISSAKELSLTIIRTMEREDQIRYTSMKRKTAKTLGIEAEIVRTSADPTDDEVINIIRSCNDATGLLIQFPLHRNLSRSKILNAIPYKQDVEGFSKCRMGETTQTVPDIYSPVAMAIMHALNTAIGDNIDKLRGMHVVFLGSSYMITKPLVQILSLYDTTISICNEHTPDITKFTKNADIVIAGTGQPHLIKGDDVKQGVIAIDAGVSVDKKGRIVGDLHPSIMEKAQFFTPPTGGIGPLTIAYIFKNLVRLAD
jgi:methylenetetrahydrofolate dehydrogenase (NADP+)/methenyltetrahydrofolate cyclohydrolase